MKVLIIHHLELVWEDGYERAGESFESLAAKVIAHIMKNDYDRVILTRFEDSDFGSEHHTYLEIESEDYESDYQNVASHVNDVFEYGYGWDIDILKDSYYWDREDLQDVIEYDQLPEDIKSEWGMGGHHSEIVMIEEWMKELKNKKCDVYICGAFDGECIEDLECALNHIDLDFTRINSLII